jgi:steroid 5-alpha reductase family enzyme
MLLAYAKHAQGIGRASQTNTADYVIAGHEVILEELQRVAFSAPLLMFLFLYSVTGIPATEAQSLRSKGEAYARYQRTTSAFVPWFKKDSDAA